MNEIEKIQLAMRKAEEDVTKGVKVASNRSEILLAGIFKVLVLILRFMIMKG